MTRRAVVVCMSDPDESVHGGTIRLRSLRAALEQIGYEVVFAFPVRPIGTVPVKTASAESLITRARRTLGRVKRHYVPMPTALGAVSGGLEQRVQAADADLIVLTALSLRRAVPRSAPALWVDMMDVWSDVARREAGSRNDRIARWSGRLRAAQLGRIEARVAARAAFATVAGWDEQRRLADRGIVSTWLPNAVPNELEHAPALGVPTERVAGFIANFEYWPNLDAYQLLLDQWLPRLRAAGWRVAVAGRAMDVLDPPPPGVTHLGFVSSIDEFYSSIQCTLAPIRLGGGAKVKVVESMAYGRPVLGTDFAFDGLDPDLRGLGVVVAGDEIDAALMSRLVASRISRGPLVPYLQRSVTEKIAVGLRGVN